MAEQEKDNYINNRRDQGDEEAIDEEVKESFAEDQNRAAGSDLLRRKLTEHARDESPKLSGGDVDAAWDEADEVGEETVGGTTPTPDQDVVDELGEAMGVTYSDTEPLHTQDKLAARDQNRWELDPASDPEYSERTKEEFQAPMPQPQPKPEGEVQAEAEAKRARKSARKRRRAL